jgi:transcriptional regulator with XRE-family HTH domain
MKRDLGIKFGRRLRELREARALTQAQVASSILKSVETISNFERGKTLPGLRTVAHLADILGVDMKELFALESGAPKYEADAANAAMGRQLKKLNDPERALIADFVDVLVRHRVASGSKQRAPRDK